MGLQRAAAAFRQWPAAWLMVLATLLFALMGVCVKQASLTVGTAEVVFFRGLVGSVLVGWLAWRRGLSLKTTFPVQHLWRGVAGVSALSLWFYCIAQLPLATAVTLNYMSSVWMGLFLMLRQAWLQWHGLPHRRTPGLLLGGVLVGFAGVALVLRPTLERQQWLDGLIGVVSGMLSAWAYLQVAALGKQGEPEHRVVFYFSLFGTTAGALMMGGIHLLNGWGSPHATATTGPWPWSWLLGIGVLATLAQLCMTRAYARGQPLAMANLQYLGIVHAFVLGVWLFGERLTLSAVAGTFLIVAAGVSANQGARSLKD